jgi:hypothetical protein
MSVADVAAVLGRYDDEAWIALANRGLLRRARKDLETLEVRVTAETHEDVEIAVGDRTVRMGVAGPGQAVCSCSSTVICQHVITAGLWLASAVPEPADRSGAGQHGATPAADRLHDDLMAIDAATLTSYAGLPGYRWADQMIADQAAPPSVTRDSYLAVTFERPALTVRYLGGGLDGLVLDQRVSHPERFRVAAVLAWQRAHGLVLPPPPEPRARASGESESSISRSESRARLRTTVSRVVRRRGHLAGEPLSLVLPRRAVNPIDALHFDDGPELRSSPLVERLLKSNTPDQPVPDDDEPRPAAVPAALAELRALIEAQAQRGCAGVAPGVIHERVAQAHRNLRHAGLTLFADPAPAVSPPETLLRSLFLVQRVEQALA